MRLFHARYSRSTRVLWALNELGLNAEIVSIALHPSSLRSAEYLRLNPLGRVPTFEINGLTLHESAAIVQFLAGHHADAGIAVSDGDRDYPMYLNWLHFGEASLMRDVSGVARNVFALPPERRCADALATARDALFHTLGVLDLWLVGRAYLIGPRFTAADIVTGYPLLLLAHMEHAHGREDFALSERFPNVFEYQTKLLARPAVQAALARE